MNIVKMNLCKLWRSALLALIACAMLTQFASAAQTAEEKLQAIRSLARPIDLQWRYKTGHSIDATKPYFNDSAWPVLNADSVTWGDQGLAWFRTTVIVPEKVCGIPIAGSQITLKCGVDDRGLIYLNGKRAGGYFALNNGSAVIAESAVPGEKLFVVVKGLNAADEGKLLFSRLHVSVLDVFREPASKFVDAHDLATIALNSMAPQKAAPYLERVEDALNQVDFSALESGDNGKFIASLSRGEDKLRKVSNETCVCSLIGHAHIDLQWLWRWPETVEVCNNTFSTMLNLMDQYPFVFSQSQAATYDEMKRSSPELYAKIKDRVKCGQWDVSTAGMWCEGDTNMSCGEGIVRSLMLGKQFIMQEFGIEPNVGWLPDNFGHVWTLPQIFAKSGIKYMCFARTGIGKPVFWWEAPDGSRILAYNLTSYSGGIDSNGMAAETFNYVKKAGICDYLKCFGVGDHGGGPTNDMLDVAVKLQKRTDYPTIKFSSVSDCMDEIAKSKVTFPVHASELNFIFDGCYTSHADVKRYNRECENALASSEAFASIASEYGVQYPADGFKASWKNTCFNEFHDVLCGTSIHSVYEDVKQDYEEVMKQSSDALEAAFCAIMAKANTKGDGVPIVVFNPLSWNRTESVNLASPFTGKNTNIKLTDASGKSYPGKILGNKLIFTARDVPSMGYKVFWATQVSKPVSSGVSFDGRVISNQYFRVCVDPNMGVITSIYDKVNKRDVMTPWQNSDVLQILSEGPVDMSAWSIGPIKDTKNLFGESKIIRVDAGPAKASVVFGHRYSGSMLTQEVSLYDDVPRIDIRLIADWHEPWSEGAPTIPMLKAAFTVNLNNPKATFEIPFGSIERPCNGQEVVAQKWIDLSDSNYGVSLLNNCKYGFDVKDNTMRISLLRSSYFPDPNPDEGLQEATYSLYPHKGNWREAGTTRKGYELNEPLVARVATAHAGTLPASKSYVSVGPANIVTTALKMAEDGTGYILRFYETDGKPCDALVQTSLPVKRYVETDMMEKPIAQECSINDGAFSAKVGKCEVKTYKLLL